MRIALREFKGVYDHIRVHLDGLVSTASVADASPAFLQSLNQLQMMFADGNWVFDPKFFLRKVNMNPLEDPIDVSAQTEVVNSYRNALRETEEALQQAEMAGDHEKVEVLRQVKEETTNLLTDLCNRIKEKGGWHAMLYTAAGAVDLEMNIKPWTVEEQVLILQEKLRYMHVKSADAVTEHEKIVKKLRESLDSALSKDNYYHTYARASKGKASHSPPTHKTSHVSPGRSPALTKKSSTALHHHNHTHNETIRASVASHSLTHGSKDHPAPPGIAVQTDLISQGSAASVAAEPSVDEFIQKVPSLDAYAESPPKPNTLPAEVENHVKQIVGTLGTLRTALETSHTKQEQQKVYIEQLEARLRDRVHMTDDLSTNTGTQLEGENSMFSHASNEIIDEYHQSFSHHNSFNNSFNSHALSSINNRATTAQLPDAGIAHNLTTQQVATGSAGIRGTSARRGSTLVMHRDSGGAQGGQIEYVPGGKVATSQTLRITVNNELRTFKHLLLRPNSASTGATQKKSFASILSSNPVGGKGPIDKFKQLEIQHRREQAMNLHAGRPLSPIANPRIGLFPATMTPDVALPALQMRPPSPQQLNKMSDKAIIRELSTIMGSRSSSPQAPLSRPVSPTIAADAMPPATELSTEALLKNLTDLCLKLQSSISDGAHKANVTDTLGDLAPQNSLQIGEAAIEHERREENRLKRRPESHHVQTIHQSSTQTLKRRPKTAGDVSGNASRDEGSYEDLFGELIRAPSSSATHLHSDVSIYATTLQNRYLHHLDEAKKIEEAIKRLGRASEAEELEDQQEIARSHYTSRDAFRPKSAAPHVTQSIYGDSYVANMAPTTGATTQRAFSASATRSMPALPSASHQHPHSASAVPFPKMKSKAKPKVQRVVVGSLPHVDLDAGSVTSPRLHEFSAELSNLSELELPTQGRCK